MDLLQRKAYDFALRIVRLSEYLQNEKKEFILSRKVLDSGTNIGLLIEEESKEKTALTSYKNILWRIRKRLRQTFSYGCCATHQR